MLRFLVAAAGSALLAPGIASAAPFGELPFRPVSKEATCLRATGAPGELVRQKQAGVEVLQASSAGLTPVAALAGVRLSGCVKSAARPSGAGVIAFLDRDRSSPSDRVVRAALREPGLGWGAPVEVLRPASDFDNQVAVAATDRGDALVAVSSISLEGRARVQLTRRAPGAAFGAPETLSSARSSGYSAPSVRAGLSATGEAVVAWAAQPRDITAARELWVAVAAPGAAFGPPKRVGRLRVGATFELAVGPDGRALLAFPSGKRINVSERAPGADFGAAAGAADADDALIVLPTVALRPDGGAVVAWTELVNGSASAIVRERPGPFGAPAALGASTPLRFPGADRALLYVGTLAFSFGGEFGMSGPSGTDADAGNPRAAFLADGRVLVTWAGSQRRDGVWWSAPRSAVLSSGGPPEAQTFGAELREADSVTPLLLVGGAPAVAWTDHDPSELHGRVHLALEGGPQAADPSPPTVRITGPRRRVLEGTDPLELTVICSAACDVRAQVEGRLDATAAISLPRAGKRQLKLASELRPIAPLRTGPVRIQVRYGAPGARQASATTATLRLRRLPSPPPARVRGLSARRDGGAIVVRWRTSRPVDPDDFFVYGSATGAPDAVLFGLGGLARESAPRTRFVVRVAAAKTVRWVTVLAGDDFALNVRRTTVRVSG